jgi:uncharacterized protein YcsI (UPF0317 family)
MGPARLDRRMDIAPAPDAQAARQAIRAGRHARHTAGLAPGRLQCNLAAIPEAAAADFLRFCLRNPRACPVVSVGDPGDPCPPFLGPVDLRTDLPRYRVWRDGVLVDEPTELRRWWRPDLVAVLLGCSFTFERALDAAGLTPRNWAEDRTVPMYRTTIPCAPAGRFAGGMVVSMRPYPPEMLGEVRAISARYPLAHGAPVHWGDPAAIGIADLGRPDHGEAVTIRPGEVPVFWACGVTPQEVALAARLPLFVAHAPGHMLITDVPEDAPVPPDPAPPLPVPPTKETTP